MKPLIHLYHALTAVVCLAVLFCVSLVDAQQDEGPMPWRNARMIYVSPTGDDANSGLSADEAVKTVEQGVSLLRTGLPDWLLLERGHDYTMTQAVNQPVGNSPNRPVIIAAYGEGPAPELNVGPNSDKFAYHQLTASHVQVYDITLTGLANPFSILQTTNTPGRRYLVGGEGFRIQGRRFVGGDEHRRQVDEHPGLFPGRGSGDVYPHRSNPIWITDGIGIQVDGFTSALAMDQGLTLGPTNIMAEEGRSLDRVVVSNGLISHGLRYTGHMDDLARMEVGLEPHGHSHGSLIRAHSTNVRLYRLVMAHNASRALVHFNPTDGVVTGEAINCVVYNPSQLVFQLMGDTPTPGTQFNVINCLIIEGPDTDFEGWAETHGARPFDIGEYGMVYMSGNMLLRRDGTVVPIEDLFLTQAERDAMPDAPFELNLPPVDPIPAIDLLDELTLNNPVGAGGEYENWVLEQVRDRTGGIIDSNDELPADFREDLGVN